MRIILLGATASGKTSLSLKIAEKLNTPIISVDSRQCFKYLDIGTAKPEAHELELVPHYNISLFNPDENDSAMDFHRRAIEWEKEIIDIHKPVFYVGGSTLHLQSLIRPFNDLPTANEANLKKLNQEIENKGLDHLYEILKQVDPSYAQKMDGLNKQRILRALDVWMQTGKSFSSFHQDEDFELPENTLIFGLHRSRENLYERINHRVDSMFERGLIEETEKILNMGFDKTSQSLNTVGYKEVISFLEGNLNKKEMIEKVKTSTRRYAKRQLTWFARWPFVEWLAVEEKSEKELCENIISHLAAKS